MCVFDYLQVRTVSYIFHANYTLLNDLRKYLFGKVADFKISIGLLHDNLNIIAEREWCQNFVTIVCHFNSTPMKLPRRQALSLQSL